jgi:hypothetical protein
MYFGTYQIGSPHREFDTIPHDVPYNGPGVIARLFTWLRRFILH